MPNNLHEIAKISFRGEFSFEICNSYDVSSKQNGLFKIYRIYIKSFMFLVASRCVVLISQNCCTLINVCPSSTIFGELSCLPVRLHARARTRGLATCPVAPHVLPQGSCTDVVPTRENRAPSSTASSPSVFLVIFSSTQCRSAPPLNGRRPQRRQPAGLRPAKGGFLLPLSMILLLSLRFQFNQAVFTGFPRLR
jgi:hypothetical protein